jgi:hypothetical protein
VTFVLLVEFVDDTTNCWLIEVVGITSIHLFCFIAPYSYTYSIHKLYNIDSTHMIVYNIQCIIFQILRGAPV